MNLPSNSVPEFPIPWMPMLVFEVTFAMLLLIKSPRRRLDELARQTEYRSLY